MLRQHGKYNKNKIADRERILRQCGSLREAGSIAGDWLARTVAECDGGGGGNYQTPDNSPTTLRAEWTLVLTLLLLLLLLSCIGPVDIADWRPRPQWGNFSLNQKLIVEELSLVQKCHFTVSASVHLGKGVTFGSSWRL